MKNFILITTIFLCLSIKIKAQSIQIDSPKLLNSEAINLNNEKMGKQTLNDSSIRLSETSVGFTNDTTNRELKNFELNKNDSIFFDKIFFKRD